MCDEVSKSLEFSFYTIENLCNIAKGKLNQWGEIDTSGEVRRAQVREAKVALCFCEISDSSEDEVLEQNALKKKIL